MGGGAFYFSSGNYATKTEKPAEKPRAWSTLSSIGAIQ
jgi:hypothetical protein